MTNLPDDQIDPYESRLTRRVGDFAERAVRPIDAAAIAAAAHAGARRQTLGGRLFGTSASMSRLGVVLAGALVAAAAFGVYVSGSHTSPNQSSNEPIATPTDVPGAAEPCVADDLAGVITTWEGAAGHRVATIDLHNGGSTPCALPATLRPALVDADGHALIVGPVVTDSPPFVLQADAGVEALVDLANYCGAAPTAGLRIRLYLPDQTSIEAAPAASMPNLVDPPPCNGPNLPAEIVMQSLHVQGASS